MMKDLLEEIMNTRGPCMSTDLTQILIQKHGLAPASARKRVSRGFSGMRSLDELRFPLRAKFLYQQKDYGTPRYWDALKSAILCSDSAYRAALETLIQRNGIMPRTHFLISCGAPLAQKKHLSPETIVARFLKVDLLRETELPGVGTCLVLNESLHQSGKDEIGDLRARLVTEGILLMAIKTWVRNLGLVSYEKVKLRDVGELPQVGTFAWDLTGPSYLAPMVEWKEGGKLKPGFVVCDILLGTEVSQLGMHPFVQKCITLRNLKNVGRCLQIFVAESYSPDALQYAKSKGIIPATPETLFGKEVAQSLRRLTEILSTAARVVVKTEVFNELFQELGRIEGAAANLRGALFEHLVAELVRQKIGATITLNKIFKDENGEAEVDVVAVHGKESVIFIECKGYNPDATVDDQEIERWLTKRIPLVYGQARQHPDWKNMKIHFEFWVTGKLSSEAISMIKNTHIRPNKYSITYLDSERVYAYAKETKDSALIKTLAQHFLKHPMITVEAKAGRRVVSEIRARDVSSLDRENKTNALKK